jgi:hypothetical protein
MFWHFICLLINEFYQSFPDIRVAEPALTDIDQGDRNFFSLAQKQFVCKVMKGRPGVIIRDLHWIFSQWNR